MTKQVKQPALRYEDISAELLNLLPFPVLLIDSDNRFVWLNPSAESFFQSSTAYLSGRLLTEMLPADSPFFLCFIVSDRLAVRLLKKPLGLSVRS